MKFRAPTASYTTLIETNTQGQPSNAQRAKLRTKGNEKRASISLLRRGGKHQAVQEAKKREKVKGQADKAQVPVQRIYPWVYVGNFDPSVTEDKLRDWFGPCGVIKSVNIRCSRGQAVSVGLPSTVADRRYATMEFTDVTAAKLALLLDGTPFDGRRIVVSTTVGRLPEVQDWVYSRLRQTRDKSGSFKRQLKSRIPVEPTELLELPAKTDRHRFFGVSFAKCVL